MDELNYEELERIPIPEGLEERLSAKIDEWESLSKGEGGKGRPSLSPNIIRYAAVAACILFRDTFGRCMFRKRSIRIGT